MCLYRGYGKPPLNHGQWNLKLGRKNNSFFGCWSSPKIHDPEKVSPLKIQNKRPTQRPETNKKTHLREKSVNLRPSPICCVFCQKTKF